MALTIASTALGMALTLGAPQAFADPVPLPGPAPVDPAIPTPAPPPGPAPDGTVQAAAGALPTPPDGTQHLSSPENLPPGTTETPTTPTKLGYLRALWHAMQTQEVTGSDALLLLTQRPMSAGPTPAMSPVAPPPAPAPADPAPVTP
jgi:hypothetical protein